MKAKNLFFGALTCLAFAACSNDDEPVVNGAQAEGNGDQFVVVNIAVPATTTRADDDYTADAGDVYGNYENGTATENDITNAWFVFFDASGKAIQVASENNFDMGNYTPQDKSPYVERIAKAVLVLDEPSKIPASMLAIVNTSLTEADFKIGSDFKTLTQIQAMVADCSAATEGTFVMSNSVWDGNVTTKITSEHLNEKSDPNNAPSASEISNAKPVDIYVERVLARVDIEQESAVTLKPATANTDLGTADNQILYKYWDDVNDEWAIGKLNITTELVNVHLSYTNPYSYIIKNLPATPGDVSEYGSADWNDPTNKRSYWAKSVEPVGGKWTDYKGSTATSWGFVEYSDGQSVPAVGNEIQIYCQENTTGKAYASDEYNSNNTATKLVITARHSATVEGGSNVEDFDLIKYKTQYWLESDFLLEAAGALNSYYYLKSGSPGVDAVYSNDWASKSCVKIIKLDKNKESKQYVATPVVETTKIAGISAIYTYDNATENYTEVDLTGSSVEKKLNEKLAALPEAWCWQDGRAYYYLDIDHLNGRPAIIRNHIYQLNLVSITGLGTPVYNPDSDNDDSSDPTDPTDPEEPIIPEKPEDDAFFVTARLNVLKWRLVGQQDVEIGW